MKKIVFGFLTASFLLILNGCGQIQSNKPDLTQVPTSTASVTSSLETNKDVVKLRDVPIVQSTTVKTVKHFYPNSPSVSKPVENVSNSSHDFVVTQDLQVELYLIDKYKPGTCYGMPSPVPQESIDGMIVRNPDLTQFLKNRYNLTSGLEIYNKMKQIGAINLSLISGGNYNFEFHDGQCCTQTEYQGQVNVVGQTISDKLEVQESKTNPC